MSCFYLSCLVNDFHFLYFTIFVFKVHEDVDVIQLHPQDEEEDGSVMGGPHAGAGAGDAGVVGSPHTGSGGLDGEEDVVDSYQLHRSPVRAYVIHTGCGL